MLSFFLRSAKSRLLASAIFTALICVVLATLISINLYARWEDDFAKYQRYVPSQISICKNLENEIISLNSNWRSIEAKIQKSGCPFYKNPYSSALPVLDLPDNPGTYIESLLTATNFGKVFTFIAFVLFATWLVTQIIHDFLKIDHFGWKRLFIVIPVIATLISVWEFRYEYDGEFWQHLIINLLVLIGTAAILIYTRMIFNWVAEGFAKQQPGSSKSEPKPTIEIHSKATETTTSPSEGPASVIADPVSKLTTSERLPFATYWPRFWARCIDLFLVMLIANIISIFIPDLPIPPGMGAILLNAIFSMIFFSVVVVLYDKLLIQKFGTTPGKAAFGLHVRSLKDGGLLTPSQAQGRAFIHLKSGLYFMFYFPAIQFIGATLAWRKRNEPMLWDREANSVVLQKPIGQFRYLSFALIALVLILTVITTTMAFKQMRKNEIRHSVVDFKN